MLLNSITNLSNRILYLERVAMCTIAISLPIIILLNATGRALRSPIYWMDELAILLMVWMAMIGMSLTLKTRDAVSVTMLTDALSPPLTKTIKVITDGLVLAFGVILLVLSYRWFDPVALFNANFDTRVFSGETFNFIYEGTTNTLDVKKFWFWLIIPAVALTTTIHALSNLLQTPTTPASILKNTSSISTTGAE